jgi:phage-related protein
MTIKSVINPIDDCLVKGPCAAVTYARRINGKKPALDYIENLEKEDQAKLAKRFITTTQIGKIWNDKQFKKLGGRSGKIWEFKVHPKVRVLCFQLGKTWFLTHGFDKETGDTPRKEIDRAEQIMKEHISLMQK